jgi:class 3 adenylate cyclase
LNSRSRRRISPDSAQDLTALLAVHREMITRVSAAHDGRIVKPEGDGFWIVFPSVTAAALAAMTMQEELRLAEHSKGHDRVAMRIVITLGDVLHQEGALVGDAVVLATRIEAIAPLDEIYLSGGAWLASARGRSAPRSSTRSPSRDFRGRSQSIASSTRTGRARSRASTS